MEIDAVDKLVFHVIEKVAEDKCDLDKVIEFVVSFSREHLLSPDTLLKFSFIFGNDKMYREKYVISRACCFTFSGKIGKTPIWRQGKQLLCWDFRDLAARNLKRFLKKTRKI